MNKSIYLLIMSSTLLFAQNSYEKGDLVEITKCDKWHWCKLKDEIGYIKEWKISKEVISNKHIVLYKTFRYKKLPLFRNKNLFTNYISNNYGNEVINQKDFHFGYAKDTNISINKTIKEKYYKIVNENNKKINKKNVEQNSKTIENVSNNKVNNKKNIISNNNFFIYGGLSKAIVSVNQAESISNKIKQNYIGAEFGLGYRFNKNYTSTLSIQRLINTQTYINNILLSLNYQFTKILLKPYIGVVTGYSILHWKKSPTDIESSTDNKIATSRLIGGHIGIEYPINNNFSIYSSYQYIPIKHTTILSDDNIKHNIEHSLQFGIVLDL